MRMLIRRALCLMDPSLPPWRCCRRPRPHLSGTFQIPTGPMARSVKCRKPGWSTVLEMVLFLTPADNSPGHNSWLWLCGCWSRKPARMRLSLSSGNYWAAPYYTAAEHFHLFGGGGKNAITLSGIQNSRKSSTLRSPGTKWPCWPTTCSPMPQDITLIPQAFPPQSCRITLRCPASIKMLYAGCTVSGS